MTEAPPPRRVVLDTNLLVGAAYAPRSASGRVVAACLRGELTAVLSPALRAEYERILPRAARGRARSALEALLARAEAVEPAETPRVVPDDPEDDKLLAAALAGAAEAVLTNDRHLLTVGVYRGVAVLRPADFLRRRAEGAGA